ncbi:hypothetical protein Pelo_690 [Pelomyxa schiedti]|nr:hypothetical protein Pelo_690 [Pelomyxa schiedti]
MKFPNLRSRNKSVDPIGEFPKPPLLAYNSARHSQSLLPLDVHTHQHLPECLRRRLVAASDASKSLVNWNERNFQDANQSADHTTSSCCVVQR